MGGRVRVEGTDVNRGREGGKEMGEVLREWRGGRER